jgi:nucleoside phosphorylase
MAPPLSVLVVCAMESEAVHLRRRLSDAEELPSPAPRAWKLSKGVLHGVDVRLLLCNIGEANAAGGTSAVLASGGWRPDAVINYGCAGAHDATIREGDVVRQPTSAAKQSI